MRMKLGPKKSCASAVLSNADRQLATNAAGKTLTGRQERFCVITCQCKLPGKGYRDAVCVRSCNMLA